MSRPKDEQRDSLRQEMKLLQEKIRAENKALRKLIDGLTREQEEQKKPNQK